MKMGKRGLKSWRIHQALVYLAPAGRHVYSTPPPKPQRGDMCHLSEWLMRPMAYTSRQKASTHYEFGLRRYFS